MFGSRSKPPQPTTGSDPLPMTSQPVSPRQPVGYETVLGANTTFKGDLRSNANVRIDGTFEGAIDVEGSVIIGETARVTANINAKQEVRVAGAVRGHIHGRKIHLVRTGRVWGDLHSSTVVADEGAFIDGKITMSNHPAGVGGFNAAPIVPEVAPLPTIVPLPASTSPTGHAEGEVLEAELLDDEPR
jgi:cytoskeletal protein CcmA (bactofilin family)